MASDNRQAEDPLWREVAQFRRAERDRLIALRRATPQEDKARMIAEISASLDKAVAPAAGMTISLYWPIRAELDLRGWMARAQAAGARTVLPVVAAKDRPLLFRAWEPDCRMERGIWNIPVPAEGELLVPDIVIAPLVGVDADCYRLGNGGGYYDRTLAELDGVTRIIGIGHDFCLIPTIRPMPWDVPMTTVILGDGRTWHRAS